MNTLNRIITDSPILTQFIDDFNDIESVIDILKQFELDISLIAKLYQNHFDFTFDELISLIKQLHIIDSVKYKTVLYLASSQNVYPNDLNDKIKNDFDNLKNNAKYEIILKSENPELLIWFCKNHRDVNPRALLLRAIDFDLIVISKYIYTDMLVELDRHMFYSHAMPNNSYKCGKWLCDNNIVDPICNDFQLFRNECVNGNLSNVKFLHRMYNDNDRYDARSHVFHDVCTAGKTDIIEFLMLHGIGNTISYIKRLNKIKNFTTEVQLLLEADKQMLFRRNMIVRICVFDIVSDTNNIIVINGWNKCNFTLKEKSMVISEIIDSGKFILASHLKTL